jgi:hypothetical protein
LQSCPPREVCAVDMKKPRPVEGRGFRAVDSLESVRGDASIAASAIQTEVS